MLRLHFISIYCHLTRRQRNNNNNYNDFLASMPLFCAFSPLSYCFVFFFLNILLCCISLTAIVATNFFLLVLFRFPKLSFVHTSSHMHTHRATCLSLAAFSLNFDGLWLVRLLLITFSFSCCTRHFGIVHSFGRVSSYFAAASDVCSSHSSVSCMIPFF